MHDHRAWFRLCCIASTLLVAACSDSAGPEPGRERDLRDGIGTGSERLYGDAELATPVDPAAAQVPADWTRWLLANAHPVRSLTAHRYEDLRFFTTVLAGRRLVQLGESGHGVREYNQVKVRLIQFLHEEMGYDVIAFESGLYECWAANRTSGTAPADSTMRRCLFGVWHTAEVIQLFEYIHATQRTARPLRLAGFDVQFSSTLDSTSADLLAEAVGHVDPLYAVRVRELETGFRREYRRISSVLPNVQAWRDSMIALVQHGGLIAAYDSVHAFLRTNESIIASRAGSASVSLLARQTAFCRREFARQFLAAGGAGFEVRDAGMADNIDFLMDELYPGEKMIVWAHNAHIQHDRQRMLPLSGFGNLTRSMGTWVSQRRRSELYTIGLFMYSGTAANNDRSIYSVSRPLNNSLEALFYGARLKWIFADMLGASPAGGTEWMSTQIVGKEWGKTDYRFVPRSQYDGILFIHSASPPQYR